MDTSVFWASNMFIIRTGEKGPTVDSTVRHAINTNQHVPTVREFTSRPHPSLGDQEVNNNMSQQLAESFAVRLSGRPPRVKDIVLRGQVSGSDQ